VIATRPMITVTIEMTIATIGRVMKNFATATASSLARTV
jgi:hypothetical protein